jgi:hypothetical protein
MIQSNATKIRMIMVEGVVSRIDSAGGVRLGVVVGLGEGDGVMEGVWLGN